MRIFVTVLLIGLTAPFILLAQPTDLACPESPPSRLNAGMTAYVAIPAEGQERRNLRVREEPGGEQVGLLEPGEQFRISGEGQCGEDGLLWWPISTLDETLSGWSVEGFAPDDYLIVPEDNDLAVAPADTPTGIETGETPQDLCFASPPTRLQRGATAYASLPGPGETGFSLRVRAEPGGRETGLLEPGTLFEIIFGPECDAQGQRWWEILTSDGDTHGWSVEAIAPDNYLITPVDLQKREPITTQNAIKLAALGTVGIGLKDLDNPSRAHDIAISPDGWLLAVAENEITLWNTQTGEFVTSFPHFTDPYTNMVFSPDGQSLAFIEDQHIKILKISDGKEVQSFLGMTPLIWSGDGRYLIHGKSAENAIYTETLVFRDIAAGEDAAFIEYGIAVDDIALNPDGTQLAVAAHIPNVERDADGNIICQPAKIHLWNVEQVLAEQRSNVGSETSVWEVGGCAAGTIAFRPDGKVLAFTQYTRELVTLSEDIQFYREYVQLWDVVTGQKIGELSGESYPVFSPYSDLMATLTQRDYRAFRIWNAQLGGEIQAFEDAYYNPHAPFPSKIIFSSDRTLMVVLWLGYFPYTKVELWGVPILE